MNVTTLNGINEVNGNYATVSVYKANVLVEESMAVIFAFKQNF